MEGGSTADRSGGSVLGGAGGGGGERVRAGNGGGGMQRPRSDALNNRAAGRPMAQRARNASFALPRMRSPSFLVKEKDEDTPDANASPWGVEETEAEKKEHAKELSDKQMQTRLAKKVSMSFTNLSSPTTPGSSLSPQAVSPNTVTPSGSPVTKSTGLRKSMSMFGGNKAGTSQSLIAAGENVSMKPSAGVSGSLAGTPTTHSNNSDSFKDSAVANMKSSVKPTDDQETSESFTNLVSSPSKAKHDEAESPLSLKERHHHYGEDVEKSKVKHKKKGLGSKLRSAIRGGKREGEKDESESDGDENSAADEATEGDGPISPRGDSTPKDKGIFFKEPSTRVDDFVSYQTKPKDEKKWGRKSRMLK